MRLDSDVSSHTAEADALAMKYLRDDQLAELAKMQVSSPRKSRLKDQNIHLDRMVAPSDMSTVSRNDMNTFGLPIKHMSFASKKYLEKYGLLESDPNSGSQPHDPDVGMRASGQRAQTKGREKKTFDKNSNSKEPQHLLQNPTNAKDSSRHCFSDGDSFHGPLPPSTPSHHSASSDITSNRTPCQLQQKPRKADTDLRHRHRPPQPEHTPARLPQKHKNPSRTQARGLGQKAQMHPMAAEDREDPQKFAAYLQGVGQQDGIPQFKRESKPSERVLDIEKLRELPKLL